MASLAKCLKEIKANKIETAIIKKYAADFKADGFTEKEAAVEAVQKYVQELNTRHADVLKEVEKAIGKPVAEKPERFDVDGITVYQTTINGKNRWAVQQSENKGTDKIMGDSLHDTREEAEKEAKFEARRETESTKRIAREKEESEKERAKKEAIDADDINGFIADKTPMQKGRIRKALAKQFRFGDDGIMSVRERIENIHAGEGLATDTREEPKIQPMSRMRYHRANQQEQDAHEKKMREAGNKTVYLVNGSELGKTAYDYAQHLQSESIPSKPDKAPVEGKPEKQPWEMTRDELTTKTVGVTQEQVDKYSPINSIKRVTEGRKKHWVATSISGVDFPTKHKTRKDAESKAFDHKKKLNAELSNEHERHKEEAQHAIQQGKIESHPDYPELGPQKAPEAAKVDAEKGKPKKKATPKTVVPEGKLSQDSITRLLAIHDVYPAGKDNAKFRQQLILELTGEKVPVSKAGVTVTRNALFKEAGATGTINDKERQTRKWLQEQAGIAEDVADDIEITGTEDKTVSVDMPKSEADALTPKEQKKYLLAEIDEAIDEVAKEYVKGNNLKPAAIEDIKNNPEDYQLGSKEYTFEVPGDGEFTAWGNTLFDFRKRIVSKFPTKPLPRRKFSSTEQINYPNEIKKFKKIIGKPTKNIKVGDIGPFLSSLAETTRKSMEKGGYFSEAAAEVNFLNWLINEDITDGVRAKLKEIGEQERYSTEEEATGPISKSDIESAFPDSTVTESDGKFWIDTPGGTRFSVAIVGEIQEDTAQFKLDYGREKKEGEGIVGKSKGTEITLTKKAGIWTLRHEQYHSLEDIGLVPPKDRTTLRKRIQALHKAGKFTPIDKSNIGGAEDRARFVESQLKSRSEKGVIGKIIQRIADFIDSLVNLVKPTARGIVRGVESGKALKRRPVLPPRGKARSMVSYHGTPHVWPPEPGFPHGRPRLDKIGTGEGAAAYGWGWYSAETPDTAKTYVPRDFDLEDAFLEQYEQAQKQEDYDKMEVYEAAMMHETPAELRDRFEGRGLEKHIKKVGEFYSQSEGGQFYALDIPDSVIPKLLDWDKPLSEQNGYIKNKIVDDDFLYRRMAEYRKVMTRDGIGEPKGLSVYHALVEKTGSDKAASEYLASIGIPGNKYLDQGSRDKGDGTYNFVIWDQKVLDRVALLKRNEEKLDGFVERYSTTVEDTKGAVTQKDLDANYDSKVDLKDQAKRGIRKVISEFAQMADEYLGTSYTRLKNINPKLAGIYRRLDWDIGKITGGHTEKVHGWLLATKAMSKTAEGKKDRADLEYALMNSATEVIDPIIEKYEKLDKKIPNDKDKLKLKENHKALREVLDTIANDAYHVGSITHRIKDYFPRVLKDPEGFLIAIEKDKQWGVYSEQIKKRAAELSISMETMTDEQKANIISGMIFGDLGGLSSPSHTKQRKLQKVPGELAKYYMDSSSALMEYIYSMTKSTEARKFFGKVPKNISIIRGRVHTLQTRIRKANAVINSKESAEIKEKARKARNRDIGKQKPLEVYLEKYTLQHNFLENIGAHIMEVMAEHKITPSQENLVNDILTARFKEQGTRGIIRAYKNLSYIDTMGSFISAITQIGDQAWPLYVGGFNKTFKNSFKSLMKKSRITKEDLGLTRIAQEFADGGTLGNAVSWVFKRVGLEKLDSIGKESLANTAYDVYQEQARKDPAKLKKEIGHIFRSDAETNSVIQDLVDDKVTENIEYLVYNRILDFQPAALSEMTQKYLTAANGRIFWMLKTFTLGQFNAFRNEAYNKIKNGDRAEKIQGLRNLVRLTMFFVAANAGADWLKDWVLGRDIDFESWDDRMQDNILRLFGVSKFVTWKARTEGVGSAAVKQILPPFSFIDSLSKDVWNAGDGKGLEVPKSIPIVGKIGWWRWGKGTKQKEKLWDKRFSKKKAKLRKVKEQLEESKNKPVFRLEHRKDLNLLRRMDKFQGKLNTQRKRINQLKSKPETSRMKKAIENLETRRTNMIKQFLEAN